MFAHVYAALSQWSRNGAWSHGNRLPVAPPLCFLESCQGHCRDFFWSNKWGKTLVYDLRIAHLIYLWRGSCVFKRGIALPFAFIRGVAVTAWVAMVSALRSPPSSLHCAGLVAIATALSDRWSLHRYGVLNSPSASPTPSSWSLRSSVAIGSKS